MALPHIEHQLFMHRLRPLDSLTNLIVFNMSFAASKVALPQDEQDSDLISPSKRPSVFDRLGSRIGASPSADTEKPTINSPPNNLMRSTIIKPRREELEGECEDLERKRFQLERELQLEN